MDKMREDGIPLSQLTDYLNKSFLVERRGFPSINLDNPSEENYVKIYEYLRNLINSDDSPFDELVIVLTASSMLFLSQKSLNVGEQTELLRQAFSNVDCLNPLLIHIVAKSIFENTNTNSNILSLCGNICFCGEFGAILSLCLTWSLLLRILGKKINAHCPHPFNRLLEHIKKIDIQKMVNENETTLKTYYIIQLIANLVSFVVVRQQSTLIADHLSECLQYQIRDLQILKDWAKDSNARISISTKNSNADYELIMMIKETIDYGIEMPLDKRIRMLQDGA